MCGRYRLKNPQKAFDHMAVTGEFDFKPRYNIAPTQSIAVIPSMGRFEKMCWSFAPPWGGILLNARRETVREKASFKKSFAVRRCLVPADGFYEWVKGVTPKRPFMFTVGDEEPFAIGAFWNEKLDEFDKTGNKIESLPRCCLVTTEPNEVLLPVQDRMPVIVKKEDWEQWLEPVELDEQSFTRLTVPYTANEMHAVEVSPVVNRASFDNPDCCRPLNSL